jgi:lipopolysaccharide export system protein LptA
VTRGALVALVAMLLATAASAQTTAIAPGTTTGAGGAGGTPVEIVARNGIEWHRDEMRYVARGQAKVTQGDKTVEAETLTAYYRQPQTGGSQIYRYTADGNVKLSTTTQRVVGDRGVYDVDSGVMVLTGKALKLTTPEQEVTARDSLEYWENKRLAVARGNALVASSDGRRIRGDTLAAYFDEAAAAPGARQGARSGAAPTPPAASAARAPNPLLDVGDGSQKLDRVEAFGNVLVSTPTDIAQGDNAVYNAKTGVAQLTGNVKLTRGQNQANGDFLEINLNTGIYRLGCKPGTGSSCVRGLFVPDKQPEGGSRR